MTTKIEMQNQIHNTIVLLSAKEDKGGQGVAGQGEEGRRVTRVEGEERLLELPRAHSRSDLYRKLYNISNIPTSSVSGHTEAAQKRKESGVGPLKVG